MMYKKIFKYVNCSLFSLKHKTEDKNLAEVNFWKKEILNYIDWYNGKKGEHYGTLSPKIEEKVKLKSIGHSAIITWAKLHQEKKYLSDLKLSPESFNGMRLLDIGSGPIPSGCVFKDCELYCLDPLLSEYIKAGFPLHYYDKTKFVSSAAESMPFENDYFDAVISVNAIDHVNNFEAVSKEVQRVLKPDGKLRIHVHYHKATVTEPLEINDKIFLEAYGWCEGIEKIHQSEEKFGSIASEGESYSIWSNF